MRNINNEFFTQTTTPKKERSLADEKELRVLFKMSMVALYFRTKGSTFQEDTP